MAGSVDATLTVGDRQRSIRATLRNEDGSLATLTAVSFLMRSAVDNVVKVNYQPCVIESPGVARYDLQPADVDTKGIYYIWFRDIDAGGRPQHWPDAGREYAIQWVEAA
jgi:hypothetical protein